MAIIMMKVSVFILPERMVSQCDVSEKYFMMRSLQIQWKNLEAQMMAVTFFLPGLGGMH